MTIDVDVFGKNMDISDRVDNYVSTKTSKLDRYLSGIEDARVELSYVKSARSVMDRYVAQITVRGRKFMLRSEERADDVQAAFDQALDKIQRQISRYKGKRYRGRGDGQSLGEFAVEDLGYGEEDIDDSEIVIARRKRFPVTPMDEYEAVEQMQLLGHESFFVFYNFNTSTINVVYKRRDGSYGLIEPELA